VPTSVRIGSVILEKKSKIRQMMRGQRAITKVFQLMWAKNLIRITEFAFLFFINCIVTKYHYSSKHSKNIKSIHHLICCVIKILNRGTHSSKFYIKISEHERVAAELVYWSCTSNRLVPVTVYIINSHFYFSKLLLTTVCYRHEHKQKNLI
jgi:preprotein translocase subunit SecG